MPGRSNVEIEIYGMEGIPEEDAREHERQKSGRGAAAGILTIKLVFFCTTLFLVESLLHYNFSTVYLSRFYKMYLSTNAHVSMWQHGKLICNIDAVCKVRFIIYLPPPRRLLFV